MSSHFTDLTVFQALDEICGFALETGNWALPYVEPMITDKGVDMGIGTFDEMSSFDGVGLVAQEVGVATSKYRRAHLVSIDGSLMVSLAASYRNSYAASRDWEASPPVEVDGEIVEGFETQTNTPVPLWKHRYDADKDGAFPDRYDVNYYFNDSSANKDGGWRGWHRGYENSYNRGSEISWVGVTAVKNPTTPEATEETPWYLQSGERAHYNGAQDRPIVACACFQKDFEVNEDNTAEGPVINDLWIFGGGSESLTTITAIMRQKVVYSTDTGTVTKYFYQFLYFGGSMYDFRSPDPVSGFFNASNLAHSPSVGFYTDEPQFDFHNTTGLLSDLPMGALSTFRDTSNTVFLAVDEGLAGANYSSPLTGGWGCGGGNICTGPLSRNGINSTAHRAPTDDYVDHWVEGQSTLKNNACSPVFAGYERGRQYLRMLDIQCYRAFDEGAHPTTPSKWEGVVDRGGVALVGVLPGLALASTATVDRAKGYGVMGDYLIFPFFTIDDNFSNDIGDFAPSVPKEDQNAVPSSRWQERSFHHRGVGLAVFDGAVW